MKETVLSLLSWYDGQPDFLKVCIFIISILFIYLLIRIAIGIFAFIIGMIQGLASRKSKMAVPISDAELAERQFGKLPDKFFVFMYDIKTGEMKQQINIGRYLCKREYDPYILCQIGAINKTVADIRFKQWKQAWLTTQKA